MEVTWAASPCLCHQPGAWRHGQPRRSTCLHIRTGERAARHHLWSPPPHTQHGGWLDAATDLAAQHLYIICSLNANWLPNRQTEHPSGVLDWAPAPSSPPPGPPTPTCDVHDAGARAQRVLAKGAHQPRRKHGRPAALGRVVVRVGTPVLRCRRRPALLAPVRGCRATAGQQGVPCCAAPCHAL